MSYQTMQASYRTSTSKIIQVLLGLIILGVASATNYTGANTEVDVAGTTTEALVAFNTEEQGEALSEMTTKAVILDRPGNNNCTINYNDKIFLQSMFEDYRWLTGNRLDHSRFRRRDRVNVRNMLNDKEVKRENMGSYTWLASTNLSKDEGACIKYGDRFHLRTTDERKTYLSGDRKILSRGGHLRTTPIYEEKKDKFEWKILSTPGNGQLVSEDDPLVGTCVPKNSRVIIQNMSRRSRYLTNTGTKHPRTINIHNNGNKAEKDQYTSNEYTWIIGVKGGTGSRDGMSPGCNTVYYDGMWDMVAINSDLVKYTESFSTSSRDKMTVTDFFEVATSITGGVGFTPCPICPGVSLSSTIGKKWSKEIEMLKESFSERQVGRECSKKCPYGVLYRWVVKRKEGDQEVFGQSCYFMCIPHTSGAPERPKCPMWACNMIEKCRCCHSIWSAASQDQHPDQHLCPASNSNLPELLLNTLP